MLHKHFSKVTLTAIGVNFYKAATLEPIPNFSTSRLTSF